MGFVTKVRESFASFKRYGFLYKIYWTVLLVGLGYVLYYDYGVYQSRRLTADHANSMDSTNTAQTNHLHKHYPSAILIGFPKCGSVAVPEHLKLHKRIGYNENFNFFHNDNRYKRGLEFYKNEVPQSAWDSIGIERSTEYIYHEKAAIRIKQMNSSVRILVGVCDPAKRALQEYRNMVADRMALNQSYQSFEEVVLTPEGKVNKDNEWIIRGQYSDYISMWLKHFPLKHFFFINGPDFRNDMLATLRELEKFLHLDPQITAINLEDYRIYKAENSPSSSQTKKPIVTMKEDTKDKLHKFYKTYNKRFFDISKQTYKWE